MVVVVEEEAFRAYFDELLQDLILSNVAEDNVLRVSGQDSKAVRDPGRLLFLLLLQSGLEIFECLCV